MSYIVPDTAKKIILQSTGRKWREFKSNLRSYYVIPYADQPKLLKFPPADYICIEQAHWDIFVASRLSDEFLEVREKQKARRKMKEYPHYMSRKGYSNVEQKMMYLKVILKLR
ncbi:uncharacterized protein LOC141724447 [Apium graveolens]|uniref:uncharacterized protein LOC141724447 n=1 Tax=Apium graveolens TaxID=4045 RepID=UPI003D7BA59B